MLKLDRLELSGFKSFVDPVELRFAGGVTGIVGPNGCGKSNLSDAIQWVLGEQSAKTLRGETMEDVIFNGSEKRKPLGMGEVSVTLSTPPGFPGSEEGRIVLSRRVFRSGESQYRLNGKLTRLKEIKDLLMDTGLGVRAYSVIEQGRIGLILSGKPQERRKLIEEAAGITRYKARKRLAEVKLEEASANLLRLDDIISEVERNLRSLKRQAGAARRFQERKGEQRELERRVLLGRWAALGVTLAAERSALASAQADEAELAAELHRREATSASAASASSSSYRRRSISSCRWRSRSAPFSRSICSRWLLARSSFSRPSDASSSCRVSSSRVSAARAALSAARRAAPSASTAAAAASCSATSAARPWASSRNASAWLATCSSSRPASAVPEATRASISWIVRRVPARYCWRPSIVPPSSA